MKDIHGELVEQQLDKRFQPMTKSKIQKTEQPQKLDHLKSNKIKKKI